jgi:hypothetical protein
MLLRSGVLAAIMIAVTGCLPFEAPNTSAACADFTRIGDLVATGPTADVSVALDQMLTEAQVAQQSQVEAATRMLIEAQGTDDERWFEAVEAVQLACAPFGN